MLKIILIGDSCVGKSCLLVRYADDKFPEKYITTIGVDFRFKSEKYENKCVKVQIWDTAGQERYRSLAKTFYRNAQGVIIVYDMTNKETFDNIKKWINEAKTNIDGFDKIPKIIIGNKCDIITERMISEEEIKLKEKEFEMKFVTASAKTGEGVVEAFNIVIKDIMKLIKTNKIGNDKSDGVIVNDNRKHKRNSCCG